PGPIAGNTSLTLNPASPVTLSARAPPGALPIYAFSVTVTALDVYSNAATGYTGTVHFSGGGTGATLPADYTFTGGDNGSHTFTNAVTLTQSASRTVTGTDTATATITGNTSLTVN